MGRHSALRVRGTATGRCWFLWDFLSAVGTITQILLPTLRSQITNRSKQTPDGFNANVETGRLKQSFARQPKRTQRFRTDFITGHCPLDSDHPVTCVLSLFAQCRSGAATPDAADLQGDGLFRLCSSTKL